MIKNFYKLVEREPGRANPCHGCVFYATDKGCFASEELRFKDRDERPRDYRGCEQGSVWIRGDRDPDLEIS